MRFLMLLGFTFVAFVFLTPMWFGMMHVFGWVMPWLLIGVCFWGVKSMFGGGRRRYRYRRDWARESYGPPPPPYRPRPAQPTPIRPVEDRVPLDVEMKAAQIRRKVEVLRRHGHEFPLGSQDLYIVNAIAKDYLPQTLDAYLKLPPRGRDKVVVNDGKTALQELREQLSLLDSKLDEIAQDLERNNLDRLLANRKFLEERFAKSA